MKNLITAIGHYAPLCYGGVGFAVLFVLAIIFDRCGSSWTDQAATIVLYVLSAAIVLIIAIRACEMVWEDNATPEDYE